MHLIGRHRPVHYHLLVSCCVWTSQCPVTKELQLARGPRALPCDQERFWCYPQRLCNCCVVFTYQHRPTDANRTWAEGHLTSPCSWREGRSFALLQIQYSQLFASEYLYVLFVIRTDISPLGVSFLGTAPAAMSSCRAPGFGTPSMQHDAKLEPIQPSGVRQQRVSRRSA